MQKYRKYKNCHYNFIKRHIDKLPFLTYILVK